jgi:hypothetical protein
MSQTVHVLIHFFEVVGVYSTPELAEKGKRDGHVATLDPKGWFVQEWPVDKFLSATR